MGEERKALWVSPEAQRQFDAMKATGPQRSDSGAPNPDTDDLVTVELTREEAEWIVSITGYRNTAEGRKYKDPACGIDDKIRAALKGEA